MAIKQDFADFFSPRADEYISLDDDGNEEQELRKTEERGQCNIRRIWFYGWFFYVSIWFLCFFYGFPMASMFFP